jgi:hypothetical protein
VIDLRIASIFFAACLSGCAHTLQHEFFSPQQMLDRIKTFVEKENFTRASVEREFGVELVPAPETGRYIAVAARGPLVPECTPEPSRVLQQFSFREASRAVDLTIAFRPGFAFTHPMIGEVFAAPWHRKSTYEGRWTVYQFDGKENAFELWFHTNMGCHHIAILMRPERELHVDRPSPKEVQDKADILDFLKRFLKAAERDAFLDPDRLKAELGIEALEWTAGQGMFRLHRHTTRVRTNVPVFDTTDIANHLIYSIVPHERRYSFHIDRVGGVICLTDKEVVSALGQPDDTYLPHHPHRTWAGSYGYVFASPSRRKAATFHYVAQGGKSCLDWFGIMIPPAR